MIVRPSAFALGAEVEGVDPAESLDDACVARIRAAWLNHGVIVLRDAQMTVEQHIAFSRRFGQLEIHPVAALRNPHYPEIMDVTNRLVDGKRSITADTGRQWHSDGAFTLRPPTGSLLHCRALPSVGGDTWFTNMYMAYERLSPTFQRMVDDLHVVNCLDKNPRRTRDPRQSIEDGRREVPAVVQPMVRVHPETGRKALYLSETVTTSIDGMTAAESEGVLQYLYRHCVRPEFTYRHRWRLHDLVFWDNRCTMHLAPADYDPAEVRHMCRTTLAGEPSGHLHGDRMHEPAYDSSGGLG